MTGSPAIARLLVALRRRTVLKGLGVVAAIGLAPRAASAGGLELAPLTPNPEGGFSELWGVAGYAPGAGARLGGAAAKRVAALAPPANAKLRIFHFNDMHNYLVSAQGAAAETHAISQFVKRVRAARAKAKPGEAVLFLSSGDDRTGTGLDALLGDVSGKGFVVDPAYVAYSAAGVDAGAIGNHEFDHGAHTLKRGIRGAAKFPMLAANLHGSGELEPGRDYFPAAIGIAGGVRVALLGLTTPVMKHFRKAADPGLAVASPVAVAKELLPTLAAHADVILILSHCGFGEDFGPARKADGWRFFIAEGDVTLARAIAGLVEKPVAILGGHTHTVLNSGKLDGDNVVSGIPILQAGAHGKFLGEAVLTLAAGKDTRMSAKLHATRRADEAPPRGESPEDYDRDFESRVVDPLQARARAL